jgi:hypothetical protein
MKKWENPEFEVLSVAKTAAGILSPNVADSDKTQIERNDGIGWQVTFGLNASSGGNAMR